ncbi:MAG: HNH endonuclease [Deltaproteobacteria bacterium]|jgi:putative restriction endonuclease
MLDKYVRMFGNLRTDKNRKRWSSVTCFQAPHKPFVLFSVMDLILQGQITDNFIEPSLELVETFNIYWARIMPVGTTGNMAYPFPRLKNDGFWHLVPNPGFETKIDMDFSSMTRLREICAGEKLDDELFALLMQSEPRQQLRMALINTYFSPEIRFALIEQGTVNLGAYEYSRDLLSPGQAAETGSWWEKQQDSETATAIRIRDQGFRKAVVTIYEHRCALCGIRMLTPEGHTVVEAAHIRPWSESHDDKPTNGLALCRLCHWSFDEGLMSVGTKYEVLVSRKIQVEQNLPGHILTLRDRPIFTPAENHYWPSQDNLDDHRTKRFLR